MKDKDKVVGTHAGASKITSRTDRGGHDVDGHLLGILHRRRVEQGGSQIPDGVVNDHGVLLQDRHGLQPA